MKIHEIYNVERKILSISIYVDLGFSFFGILLGVLSNSQLLLLDALYSVLTIGLARLSLYASKFMSKQDRNKFPFGKTTLEPLVLILNYLVLLILICGAIIASIFSILNGGRVVILDIILGYTALSTTGCFAYYFYLKKISSKYSSGLIHAQKDSCFMDAMISASVLFAFVIAYISRYIPSISFIAPYMDPVMVLIVSAFLIRTPIVEIYNSIKELLYMAPEPEFLKNLESIVYSIEKKYGIAQSYIRASKGRKLLKVEVDFVVDSQSKIQTIKDQDLIREELATNLDTFDQEKWLTIAFTNDRKWAH